MKMYFEYGGEEGIVAYDRKYKSAMVSHPDETMRKALSDYLKEDTSIRVPSFDGTGNMALNVKPVSSEQTMELGMSKACSILGIKMIWDHKGSVPPTYVKGVKTDE